MVATSNKFLVLQKRSNDRDVQYYIAKAKKSPSHHGLCFLNTYLSTSTHKIRCQNIQYEFTTGTRNFKWLFCIEKYGLNAGFKEILIYKSDSDLVWRIQLIRTKA